MQYWKPEDGIHSVGDCMPFWRNGRFHLFYLLDEGHHNNPVVGRLGGHLWAHSSSADLKAWTSHPYAVPVEFGRGEASVCTGSPLALDDGTVIAFYALRPLPPCGEFIRMSKSANGIDFEKVRDFNLAPPPGFGPGFRDPVTFKGPDGRWQMLVATEDKSLPRGLNGCLGRFSSSDLFNWSWEGVMLRSAEVPECPDLFEWDGLYYLLFGNAGGATRYAMAKSPLGPWTFPRRDILACQMAKVLKTAAFGKRRIGAAWIPSRKPDGGTQWGGRALFRELVRRDDGSLGVTAVPEMEFDGALVKPVFKPLTSGVSLIEKGLSFAAKDGFELACVEGLPSDFKWTLRIQRKGAVKNLVFDFGEPGRLELRFEDGMAKLLRDNCVCCAEALAQKSMELTVLVRGEIFDVRIGGDIALANATNKRFGGSLRLFCDCGELSLENVLASSQPPLV